jgi:hypothetical protein
MRRLFLLLIVSLCAAPSIAGAQDSTAMHAGDRVSVFLNGSLSQLGGLTEEFNQHVAAINALRPMDPENLDSSRLEATTGSVLRFTQYLQDYLHRTDSVWTGLIDSLSVLGRLDPNPDIRRSLKAFEASYKTDQTAWKAYVQTFDRVYNEVLNTLLFLSNAPHQIADGGPRFVNRADLKRYNEFIASITKLTVTLQSAAKASEKATAAANKQLQSLNLTHERDEAVHD